MGEVMTRGRTRNLRRVDQDQIRDEIQDEIRDQIQDDVVAQGTGYR